MEESTLRRARRKACDLCYRKKIKCDGSKPRCAHCQVYESECTYNAQSRKAVRKVQGNKPHVESLESRLQFLEARLKAFEEKDVEPAEDILSTTHTSCGSSLPIETPSPILGLGTVRSPETEWTHQRDGRRLPPLAEVLPVVEDYFTSTNRLLPLFDEAAFRKQLHGWYASPVEQDPAAWAAINVVLGLGKRHYKVDGATRATVDRCVRNAQSLVSSLVTRYHDLLGIQILLGLSMVFQGTSDPRPATILMATAVRLAHALKLNRKCDDPNSMYPHPIESRAQCDRVFWVMFILDRDIAMKIRQPAMQLEGDISVDLPADSWGPSGSGTSTGTSSNLGVVYSITGSARLHFFRSRIRLAWIQGKIYDWLYSVKAEQLPAASLEANRARLEALLAEWYSGIPDAFRPAQLFDAVDPTTFRCFVVLHFTHLQALASVNNTYAHNSSWILTLQHFSRDMVHSVDAEALQKQLPLPRSWDRLVELSRACMQLFMYMPQRDMFLVWPVACSYFTAVIFLIVNCMVAPADEHHAQDQGLVENALEILGALVDDSKNERLEAMRNACVDLLHNAQRRVMAAQARVAAAEQAQLDGLDQSVAAALDHMDHPGFGEGDLITGLDLEGASSGAIEWQQWFDNRRETSMSQYMAALEAPGLGEKGGDDLGFEGFIAEMMKQNWQ